MSLRSSSSPLDAVRVRALAEAFGADPARWPETEREAALAWLQAHPAEASTLLAEARALDGVLDAWRLDPPPAPLVRQVLAPAPVVVRQARRRAFILTLGGGAGLAAACLAGILAAPSLLSPSLLSPSLLSSSLSGPLEGALAVPSIQLVSDDEAVASTDEVLVEVLADWEAPVGDPADPAP